MARIFQTGFEAGSSGIFNIAAGNGSIGSSTTRGSWSTYAWNCESTRAEASLDSSVTEFYFGIGFRVTGVGRTLIGFKSPTSTEQLTFKISAASFLEVRLGSDSGTILGTGTKILSLSTWYYLEGHVTIHDSTGTVEAKIDGVQDINLTGQDTRNDASSGSVDRLFVREASVIVDDIYVNSTTGTQNTGYSNDVRISAYIPNAAGTTTGLSRGGSDSGSNYGQVDERPPNDSTDYVYDSVVDDFDLYGLPNTSGVTSVQAVTTWIKAQKNDAGAASIAHMLRSGGTNDTGSDVALSTSWTYYRKNYNVDPTDSNAWTTGKLDALEVGVKVR